MDHRENVVYVHSRIFSAIEKNKAMPLARKRVQLKMKILSEFSWLSITIIYFLSFMVLNFFTQTQNSACTCSMNVELKLSRGKKGKNKSQEG